MGEHFKNKNKPAIPAPPLNALKKPEVKKPERDDRPERWKPRASVYEEIAERRKSENHSIGVTPPELRDQEEVDDVKVYTPSKKKPKIKAVRILDEEEETEKPKKGKTISPRKRAAMWIAIISVLSVMCVAAGVAYCAVNGYFDGLIGML